MFSIRSFPFFTKELCSSLVKRVKSSYSHPLFAISIRGSFLFNKSFKKFTNFSSEPKWFPIMPTVTLVLVFSNVSSNSS